MATGIGQYGFGSKTWRYADAGKYFVCKNVTAGTGLVTIAAADALDDLETFILVKNGNGAGSGVNVYLDFLRLDQTAAGVGHTAHYFSCLLDVSTKSRYTSGGAELTKYNVNGASQNASAAVILGGPLITVSAGERRDLATVLMRSVIGVVGDSHTFNFGTSVTPAPTALSVVSTGITHKVYGMPPVIIGPQQHCALNVWGASMSTGAAYEVQLGYVEV